MNCKAPFFDVDFVTNASAGNTPSGKITAVRVIYDDSGSKAQMRLVSGISDRLDGLLSKDNTPISTELPAIDIAKGIILSVNIHADNQGAIMISRNGWLPDCEIVHTLALGAIFPMDFTDTTGLSAIGRRLYWEPGVKNPTFIRDVKFDISGDGFFTWESLGISAKYDMTKNVQAGGTKSVHLALLVRNGEKASITLKDNSGAIYTFQL